MKKKRLGRTALAVTELGLGAIPIQRRSTEDAIRVVERCLDLGINFIDTANGYTDSEDKIGRAIAGRRREDIIIATKSASWKKGGLLNHLELSLKRMGTDYIDILQLHNVTTREDLDKILGPGGAMEGLREAQAAGKVRHIGFSSHSFAFSPEVMRTGLFETIQIPFNFIAIDAEVEILPLAKELDIGVIGMKPFAGGVLEDVRLAFGFLARYDQVVPIPGIERVEEIEEVVKAVEEMLELTVDEEAEINLIQMNLGSRFCRRCQYCYPCPEGIKIAMVTGIESFSRRLPSERLHTGWIADVLTKARDCQQCGVCEERCPYHLPVRELIQEGLAYYDQWLTENPAA